MALSYVQLTLDLYDGTGNHPVTGTASFTPSAVLTGAGAGMFGQIPVTAAFGSGALPSVKLLATDNAGLAPSPWTWTVTFTGIPGVPASRAFSLAYANGASQLLSKVW